jgi:hypothetical protein
VTPTKVALLALSVLIVPSQTGTEWALGCYGMTWSQDFSGPKVVVLADSEPSPRFDASYDTMIFGRGDQWSGRNRWRETGDSVTITRMTGLSVLAIDATRDSVGFHGRAVSVTDISGSEAKGSVSARRLSCSQ